MNTSTICIGENCRLYYRQKSSICGRQIHDSLACHALLSKRHSISSLFLKIFLFQVNSSHHEGVFIGILKCFTIRISIRAWEWGWGVRSHPDAHPHTYSAPPSVSSSDSYGLQWNQYFNNGKVSSRNQIGFYTSTIERCYACSRTDTRTNREQRTWSSYHLSFLNVNAYKRFPVFNFIKASFSTYIAHISLSNTQKWRITNDSVAIKLVDAFKPKNIIQFLLSTRFA